MNDAAQVVPECLRNRPQWVTWRYVQRGSKATKVPVNPTSLELADSTDPGTWSTLDLAVAACQRDSSLAGVGFVFTPGDPYCGIDLDDCIAPETGQLKDWAAEIVRQFDSYTEISPSGTGVKIFLKANKPSRRCRKGYHDGEVEIYDSGRFFTVTGDGLGWVSRAVEPRQEALEQVYRSVFGEDGDSESRSVSAPTPSPPLADTGHAELDDHEIIEIASKQRRSGEKFRTLWAGDWNTHFNSASEADSSVVFTLAFYTKDAAQIDRLFRQSGLMRPKWDEQHGAETYGHTTIAKALAKVTRQYTPKRKDKAKPKGRTSAESAASSMGTATNVEPPRPGTIDPITGRLILATNRTLPTAQAFVDQFYCHKLGRTLHHYAGLNLAWRDGRYAETEDNGLRHQLLPWMHDAVQMVYSSQAEAYIPRDFPANPRTVNAALESVKSHTHLPATVSYPCWLTNSEDTPDPRDIVPCRSSLLHLPTMRKLPSTPQFFSLSALDYDPAPDAAEPTTWLQFLHELFDGDIESWDLLQDWFGYCLTGDTSLQKMLLIVGPKRSGKGTIARVLTQLIGTSNICGPTTSSLAGPFGLQPLLGKSLAIVSDARFSGDGIQTVIERLLCISGEDSLTIDRKHLPSVTMKLPTRFMFLTNELPWLQDASGALAGRFMMLRLTESFYGKEDRKLTEKLLNEIPGIFNWAVEGWRRVRDRGSLHQPSCVAENLDTMLDLASPVTAFVSEMCDTEPGHRTSVEALYEAWRAWCLRQGMTTISSRQTFGRDLIAAFPHVTCRRNHATGRFYEGIGLLSQGGYS